VNVTLELGPLESCLIETFRRWRNDPRIWRWTRQNDFISDISQRDWLDRMAKCNQTRMYQINLRIDDRPAEPVGVCGLTNIDWGNRRTELSLYIAPEHHRKGFGRRACDLLLMHAFVNLNLRLVWAESFDGNPAIKMFESLGFVREGTRRDFYWKDGRYWNAHLLSIKVDEWITSKSPTSPSASPSSSSSPSASVAPLDAAVSTPQKIATAMRRPRGRPRRLGQPLPPAAPTPAPLEPLAEAASDAPSPSTTPGLTG